MKRFATTLFIWLFLGSLAFAPGLEQPPGEPPFGVAVQSDAPGTKLNGGLFIEFYNIDTLTKIADARIVLRLRKGDKDLETFFGEASGVDTANPGAVQDAMIAEMGPQVIDRFFGNNNGLFTDDPLLQVKLKSMTEFGQENVASTDLTLDAHPASPASIFILTDLQIAVS